MEIKISKTHTCHFIKGLAVPIVLALGILTHCKKLLKTTDWSCLSTVVEGLLKHLVLGSAWVSFPCFWRQHKFFKACLQFPKPKLEKKKMLFELRLAIYLTRPLKKNVGCEGREGISDGGRGCSNGCSY